MFYKKLKELRKNNKLSQQDIASLLNVSQPTVGSWETGRTEPDNETLKKLATYFNITVDYLLNGKNKNLIIDSEKKCIKVPVLGKIPAGIPIEAIQDILDYEEFSITNVDLSKQYFGLKIKGNSMYPKYIDGDIVIFESENNCDSGDDCAILINGDDAVFKRVIKNESGILLQSLNPEYKPNFYSNEEIENLPICIIGIAIEIRRKL